MRTLEELPLPAELEWTGSVMFQREGHEKFYFMTKGFFEQKRVY